MFEILFLFLIIAAIPPTRGGALLAIPAILFIAPGTWATWTGAPFVPSSDKKIKKMIELAGIKPGEKVYDLGCGDGRVVFAAAAAGGDATGFELSIPTFLLAWFRAYGKKSAKIRMKNFWAQDYRQADVIFCYLLTQTMQQFRDRVWPQLKPGCRVVSHAFTMDGIPPDTKEEGVALYIKK